MFTDVIIIAITLSVVLSTGAVAGLFSERAGIVNIAINGIMIIGALIYAIIHYEMVEANGEEPDKWMQLPAMLIAAFGGAVFAMLLAVITINLKANHVIAGTAINIFAAGLSLFIIKAVYDTPSGTLASRFDYIGANDQYDSIGNAFNLQFFLCVGILIIGFLFLKYSPFGLKLKASGENPNALEARGVSVFMVRYIALAIAGFLAALAGAFFAQWRPNFAGNVEGLGFIALAILISGQWRIPLIIVVSLAFGVLQALGTTLHTDTPQIIKDNRDFFKFLPFALSTLALVFISKYSKAPKAAGLVYDRSKR